MKNPFRKGEMVASTFDASALYRVLRVHRDGSFTVKRIDRDWEPFQTYLINSFRKTEEATR